MTGERDPEPTPVKVTVGDHEIWMMSDKAAALTEAQRDDLAAEMKATDAALESELLARSRTQDRAHAAVAENGALVVAGWCDRCGDGADPIMWVRRFSGGGYVFIGQGRVELDRGMRFADYVRLLREGERRLPYAVRAMVHVILTEQREPGTNWPPRATCHKHGEARFPDPRRLLDLARTGGRPGRPAKMKVHPTTP